MIKRLSKVLSLSAFVFIVGFGADTIRHMPQHAYVLVLGGEYYAPPYFMEYGYDDPEGIELFANNNSFTLHKYEDIIGIYKPNLNCRDAGFFIQESRSLSGYFLEKLGVLTPFESRWSKNGGWNY
jgi:hypothetical protein